MNPVLGPTPEQTAAVRTRVMRHVAMSDSAAFNRAGRPAIPRRRVEFIALGAAAVAVAVFVVNATSGIPAPGSPGNVLSPEVASASEILTRVAGESEKAADPILEAGQYLKVSTTSESVRSNVIRGAVCCDRVAKWGWQEREQSELFIPADRTGEWVWVTDTTPDIRGGELVQTWGDRAAAIEARERIRLRAADCFSYPTRCLITSACRNT